MDIWSRKFTGLPECLAETRKFTFAVLGDKEGAHTVALVADELAGNAIKHTASGGPGGEFVVRLAVFADWCRVRVDDQGGPLTAPSLHAAAATDESGRGLTIVAMLADRWGVDGDERSRSVWADISFAKVPAISGSDDRRDPRGADCPARSDAGVGLPHQARAKRKIGMTTDDWKR